MGLPIYIMGAMQEQALQQAHDLLDTVELMCNMTAAKREQQELQTVMEWYDWNDEKPMEGERVVVQPIGGDPYFLTYFSALKGLSVKRWLRLPE